MNKVNFIFWLGIGLMGSSLLSLYVGVLIGKEQLFRTIGLIPVGIGFILMFYSTKLLKQEKLYHFYNHHSDNNYKKSLSKLNMTFKLLIISTICTIVMGILDEVTEELTLKNLRLVGMSITFCLLLYMQHQKPIL